MSLEQDEIDELLRVKEQIDSKLSLAQEAKNKIAIIYQDVCGMTLDSEL